MPLQRRTFVHVGHGQAKDVRLAVKSADGRSRHVVERMVPKQSLKLQNRLRCQERLRLVTTFLNDEEDEDEVAGESPENPGGAEARNGEPTAAEEAASPVRSRGGTRGSALTSVGASMLGCTVDASMPASPRPVSQGLSSPARLYGRATAFDREFGTSPRPTSGASSIRPLIDFDSDSYHRTRKIMAAMCRDSYGGIPQVQRKVYSGDDGSGGAPADWSTTGGDGQLRRNRAQADKDLGGSSGGGGETGKADAEASGGGEEPGAEGSPSPEEEAE
eukprot:gnl/TRDRNA2_/TRDRNA2_184593_c0_seq1.p1 gnl/TRDRNA2_/TRDRNA2_184593_c0~~gnl/TRDRNA2_/TRDRNA2_184593_c0_seq1.p1  ORF type:complete len:275 (+),score=59.75 gnl/TRDRNA2_/TRDRNA2_184593_c0_seq1:71-895(+)